MAYILAAFIFISANLLALLPVTRVYALNPSGPTQFAQITRPSPVIDQGYAFNSQFADVNNDGKQDLATLETLNGVRTNIVVRLGNGGGGYGAVRSTTMFFGQSLKLVDVNKDGVIDAVTVNKSGNALDGRLGSFEVRMGVGDGTFATSAQQSLVTPTDVYDSYVSDVNNDGFPDVVGTFPNSYNPTTYVPNFGTLPVAVIFVNNGAGVYAAGPQIQLSTTDTARVDQVADLTGDGKVDLLVGDDRSAGLYDGEIYAGNGSGGFAKVPSNNLIGIAGPAYNYWAKPAVADFNNDGKKDVVAMPTQLAIPSNVNAIKVLLNQGNNSFSTTVTSERYGQAGVDGDVVGMTTADVNQDGFQDLLTNRGDNVDVYLGDGTGKLTLAQILPVAAAYNYEIGLGDFNNDSKPDITLGAAGRSPFPNAPAVALNVSPPPDRTSPTVVGSPDRQANAAGWYKSDVTIAWTATDPAPSSGTPTQPPATIASQEGDHTYTSQQSCDPAGNCATGSLALKIDKTSPTLNYSLSAAPNSNGWTKEDVVVTFSCDDSTSGIYACSVPVTVSEGENQLVTGTAVDVAGNTKVMDVVLNVDKGKPTIAYAVSPTPNDNGWNKDNATVSFTCMDALSGIDECTVPQVIESEGANNQVTGTAVDKAGNSQSVYVVVKLDKTNPSITYTLSQPSNVNGWNDQDVTVTFVCDDNLSGAVDCPDPVTLSEGANQHVNGSVYDVAGNTKSVSLNVNVDKGKPTITDAISSVPNAAGWYKDDATVTFSCADSLSGIDFCSSPQAITGDTTGLVVTGSATDKAGNNELSTTTVKLDKTDPSITYQISQNPNVNGWNDQDVTVTFVCDDVTSGVTSCSSPVTLGEGENQTVMGTAIDVAGNTKTVSVTINIDKGKPTIVSDISPLPNAAGWNKTDATVGFACADTLSGLDSCTDAHAVTTEGANNQVTGTAVDKAGNSQSATTNVKLDKTTPTITYSLDVQPNGSGWNNTDVTIAFSCADALSGLQSCSAPVALGEGMNQSVTGTAIDIAGNVKTVLVVVSVDKGKPTIAYAVSPVPNAAGWNRTNLAVNFTCLDGLSLIQSCTPSQSVNAETSSLQVTGTAIDYASNSQSVTATVKLDKTLPITTNAALNGGLMLGGLLLSGTTNITANVSDSRSGVTKAEYFFDSDPGPGNGVAMAVGGGTASANNVGVSNLHGQHTVYVRSQDVAGNWSAASTVVFSRL